MSRKHPWDFKNRREQHKYLVDLEQCCKFSFRHIPNITKHSKERWRKVYNVHYTIRVGRSSKGLMIGLVDRGRTLS